ncbi:ISAzo13 family transposase, partial [Staphylococcus aureus]|nr:ISAzo13 family transposase [Staphylococcus aureus]
MVNVGCDHDTSDFAVQSIHRWWTYMGRKIYPDAKKLLICADSGGSNGYRVRLWKIKLQEFANKSGMEITVCH